MTVGINLTRLLQLKSGYDMETNTIDKTEEARGE